MQQKPLLLSLLAAGALALTGCGAGGSLPDLQPFAQSTQRMTDAIEGTYMATRELMATAPLTPELEELHAELAREQVRLEKKWKPIREALHHATQYTHTLVRLVHHRDLSNAELSKRFETHMEGMLGPVGLLAGPLAALPLGHKLADVAEQIDRVRKIKRTMRELRRTLKVLSPALHGVVGELHDDFLELEHWTERVIKLMHEQNRLMHEEAVEYEKQLAEHEKQVTAVLAAMTGYRRMKLQVQARPPRDLTHGKLRRKLALEAGKNAKELLDRLEDADAGLARGTRGKRPPAALVAMRKDLAQLREQLEVLGPLEQVALRLGAEPAAGQGANEMLQRIRAHRKGDTTQSYETHAALFLESLVRLTPRRGAGKHHWIQEASKKARGLAQLRRLGFEHLLKRTEAVKLALDGEAEELEAREPCRVHLVVQHLRNALREQAHLVAPPNRKKELEGAFVGLMLDLLPHYVDEVATDLEWLQALPAGRGAPTEDGSFASLACAAPLGVEVDAEASVDELLKAIRENHVLASADRAAVSSVRKALSALRSRAARASSRRETESLVDQVSAEAVVVHNLWERARLVARLAELDPDLGSATSISAERLNKRETYWRNQLEQIEGERKLVAERVTAYRERMTHLNTRHLHIKDLLRKGRTSLKSWSHAHENLSVVAGRQPHDTSSFEAAVDAHHESLEGPGDDLVQRAESMPAPEQQPDPAPSDLEDPAPEPEITPDPEPEATPEPEVLADPDPDPEYGGMGTGSGDDPGMTGMGMGTTGSGDMGGMGGSGEPDVGDMSGTGSGMGGMDMGGTGMDGGSADMGGMDSGSADMGGMDGGSADMGGMDGGSADMSGMDGGSVDMGGM